MERNNVFIKVEKREKIKDLLLDIRKSLSMSQNLMKIIEETQIREKELIEKWQRKINQADQELQKSKLALPKGRI